MVCGKNMLNLLFFVSLLFGLNKICVAENDVIYKNIADVPQEKWADLAQKKIYFGHQSVGFNIIDGLFLVMKEYPNIQLNIVESRKYLKTNGSLVHSRVGKNREPDTKILDFVNVINEEFGATPDLAGLKFCYVDVEKNVVVSELFDHYVDSMSSLKKEHPRLIIIHFTMPLRTQKITWKTRLKLMLGKEAWEIQDNLKRNQFNRLLKDTFQGSEPVFDIALYEATLADGSLSKFTYDDTEYLSMNPAYSSDGGHLNKLGSRLIAEKFLLFLVNET